MYEGCLEDNDLISFVGVGWNLCWCLKGICKLFKGCLEGVKSVQVKLTIVLYTVVVI